MAIEVMPNGEIIEYDDNITPEALKKLKAQYRAPVKQGILGETKLNRKQFNALSDEDKSKYTDYRMRNKDGLAGIPVIGSIKRALDDATTLSQKGVTMNFSDEIAGAGNFLLGQGYTAGRDRERRRQNQAYEDSPILGTAAELGSAIATPLGSGAKALQGAGMGLNQLGFSRAANALVQGGTKLENANPIIQGIGAGVQAGALSGAGAAERLTDVPGATLDGALLGGTVGGLTGGLVHGGQTAAQIYNRTRPENASREAYERVARLLEIGDGKTKYTPQSAQQALNAARADGSDMRMIDLTPGMQATGANLARKVDIEGAPELRQLGMDRMQARPDQFRSEMQGYMDGPTNALSRADDLRTGRKEAGQRDFEDSGNLDLPVQRSRELDIVIGESPDMQRAIKKAAEGARRAREPEGDLVTVDGVTDSIPTWRFFQRIKAAYDDEMSSLVRSGRRSEARDLSGEFKFIKDMIARDNPAFADGIATQRDFFQKEAALEQGKKTLQMLNQPGGAQRVQRDIKAMTPEQRTEWRIGTFDAILNAENKSNPQAWLLSMLRNPDQRKVWEAAFDGKGNLGRVERRLRRDMDISRTDAKLSGPQSITSDMKAVDDANSGLPGLKDAILNGLRGTAYGGGVGGSSAVLATFGRMATGTSKATQEELARILLSKGENIVPGTEAAALYRKRREAGNRGRAVAAGKAGQQLVTGYIGG